MTHRNEMADYHAAIIVNGTERLSLGHCDAPTLKTRLFATLAANPEVRIDDFTLYCSRTKDGLEKIIKRNGGVQAEYEHEGLNPDSPLYGLDKSVIESMVMIEDDTPSPFEGITMNRLMEANTSSEFEAYRLMACNPEKRVGVDSNHIAKLRMDWEAAYPDVAAFIPPWKE